MALTVDSLPVDPRVIAHWKDSLKTAAEVALQDFAKNHKHLNMGFRKGKVSLPVLLTRIQVMLDQTKDLPPDFSTLLRDATLSRQFICVLSEEAITHSLPQLADAYGRLNVFAALQLDERESIRKLGYEQIQGWSGTEAYDSERQKAVQELQKLFPGFLTRIQVLLGQGNAIEKSIAEKRLDQIDKRAKRTEELIADLRAKRTEFNRLQRKFNEVIVEYERISAISEARGQTLENTTNKLNLINQKYEDLSAKFELHVRNAVAIKLEQKLAPWLRPAETLEAAASQVSNELQQEAESLLRRQAAYDKKFGLRSQLAHEAASCQVLELKLIEALEQSIEPLPELGAVTKKLKNRIAEIGKILQENSVVITDEVKVLASFIEKLNAARNLDELASLRNGLLNIEAIGLLTNSELGAAYTFISDKASRLYLKADLNNAFKPQQAMLKDIPLYALQRHLADGRSCVLLIDGYNVLHKLFDLFGDDFENGIPRIKAQQALKTKISAICEVKANLTVNLWFDSPTVQDETIRSNFTVHYSGGVGKNRADDQIVSYLHYLSTQRIQKLMAVVTDDRDEAARSIARGALILSPIEFKIFIEQYSSN